MVCVRVLKATTGAVVLAALSASAANAAWTRPSVLVTGDDAGLLDTVARPDGSLRAAIVDSRHGIAMGLVDGSGEAVVAWQTNGFPSDLAAAVRLPGAGFSKARFVSRDAGYAQLAVGPGGQAILAARPRPGWRRRGSAALSRSASTGVTDACDGSARSAATPSARMWKWRSTAPGRPSSPGRKH